MKSIVWYLITLKIGIASFSLYKPVLCEFLPLPFFFIRSFVALFAYILLHGIVAGKWPLEFLPSEFNPFPVRSLSNVWQAWDRGEPNGQRGAGGRCVNVSFPKQLTGITEHHNEISKKILHVSKIKRDSLNVQVLLILMAFLHLIIFDVQFKSIERTL